MLEERKGNLDNSSSNWYERKFRLNPFTPVKVIVFSGRRLGRCLIINIETLTAAEVIYVCLPVVNHTFMRLAGRAGCSDRTDTISFFLSFHALLLCKVKQSRPNTTLQSRKLSILKQSKVL